MKFTSCLLAAALATCTVELIPAASVRADVRLAQALDTPRTNLTPDEARATASELLKSIQTRNAQGVYRLLASPLQSATSTEAISQRLQSAPLIESFRVVAVNPGLDDTTVETMAVTNSGTRELPLLLVLWLRLDHWRVLAYCFAPWSAPVSRPGTGYHIRFKRSPPLDSPRARSLL